MNEFIKVFLCDAQDLGAFVLPEALDIGELERIEPQLRSVVSLLDMAVGWLIAIGHVEKEAIASFSKNGRHAAILPQARPA